MSDDEQRRLAQWVEPPIDDRAIDRQWLAIRERARIRRGAWRLWWAAGAVAIASVSALARVLGGQEEPRVVPAFDAAPGDDPARDRFNEALAAGMPRAEALARLVDDYERAGDEVRCRAARELYLRENPAGARRAEVEHRCP